MQNSEVFIQYSDQFKCQIKRLSRKYLHIRSDVQPILELLGAGITPGEQICGIGYTIYKVRVKNTDMNRGKSGGYRIIYYKKSVYNILLVSIFSKTEHADIEPNEILQIIQSEEMA